MGAGRQLTLARAAVTLGLGAAVAWLGQGLASGEVTESDRRAAADAAARADAHAEKGEYIAAAIEFATAFTVLDAAGPTTDDDRRQLGKYLFAWATIEQLGGNCGCAVSLLDRFIAEFPGEDKWLASARSARAECGAVEAAPSLCHQPERAVPDEGTIDAGPEEVPVDAATAEVEVPPEVPATTRASWITDVPGGALAVGGLGAAVTGAYFVQRSFGRARDARADGIDYADYVDGAAAARRDARIGWPTVGVGVALLTGAVVRYWLVASDDDGVRLEVTPAEQGTGAVIGLGGRL